MRNGYFHKDNLYDWTKVDKARETAQLVFFILGAYSLSDDDKTQLGMIRRNNHDDFYKLCAYINHKYYNSNMLVHPIYYLKFDTDKKIDPYNFFIPYRDDYTEYDNYGDPIYSGLFFDRLGKERNVIKFGSGYLPIEIWEGEFIISRSIPITMKPTGPQKLIFKNGNFYTSDNE